MAKTIPVDQRRQAAADTLEHVNQITETLTLFEDDPTAMKARQAIYDELRAEQITDEDYGNIDCADFRATDRLKPEIKYLAYDPDEGTIYVCSRIRYDRKDKETGETLQLEKRYADVTGAESLRILWDPPTRLRRLLDSGMEYLRSLIPPGTKINDSKDAIALRDMFPPRGTLGTTTEDKTEGEKV